MKANNERHMNELSSRKTMQIMYEAVTHPAAVALIAERICLAQSGSKYAHVPLHPDALKNTDGSSFRYVS